MTLYNCGTIYASSPFTPEAVSAIEDILDREIVVKACNESLFYLGKIPEDPRIICEDMADLLQSMLTADRVVRL